jgi:hypothetical protein
MVERLAAFAFDAQIVLDAALLSHQTHQALRLMSIELIGDKDPDGLWVTLDRLDDTGSEVCFSAGGADAGSHKLASGHFQVCDKASRTMSLVFKFLAFDMAGQHR